MIVRGSAEFARMKRRAVVVDGDTFYKSEWMETTREPELSPTVFLVEQAPNVSLKTHWHHENQFQVFVEGSATIGHHEIRPVTVHYAGAYTGYGPLVSGPHGLSYFTIRSVFESGAKTDTSAMKRGPKRHCMGGPSPMLDEDALHALKEVDRVDLIAPQPDAVAARLLRIPPHASARADIDRRGAAGQFHLVLAGSLKGPDGEGELRRWEQVFVSPEEDEPTLVAGDAGCEVLCLQLPPKEAAYRD